MKNLHPDTFNQVTFVNLKINTLFYNVCVYRKVYF